MSVFKDKVLLITGGTGSIGNAVLNRFLRTDIGEIRIFSRDEKKQDDMRHDFQARMPEVANKIKFYIGDVRNRSTLKYAMKGVDYVFHAAALKQVPSCEFFPVVSKVSNEGFAEDGTNCKTVRYNRFAMTGDKSGRKNFRFNSNTAEDKRFVRQRMRPVRLITRIYAKIVNAF